MEVIFKGTGLTALYLDQGPQVLLKNKMGNFDEAKLQKSYAWAQSKYDEMATIANRSLQIGRKVQVQKNTAPPPGFNITPAEDPSVIS